MKIRSFQTKVLLGGGPAQWHRTQHFILSHEGISYLQRGKGGHQGQRGKGGMCCREKTLRQCFQINHFKRRKEKLAHMVFFACIHIN